MMEMFIHIVIGIMLASFIWAYILIAYLKKADRDLADMKAQKDAILEFYRAAHKGQQVRGVD